MRTRWRNDAIADLEPESVQLSASFTRDHRTNNSLQSQLHPLLRESTVKDTLKIQQVPVKASDLLESEKNRVGKQSKRPRSKNDRLDHQVLGGRANEVHH